MFTVYSKPSCTYCEQSKALLESKSLPYEVVHLDVGQPKVEGEKYISRDDLLAKIPSARTMPQILNDGQLLGGYRELQQFVGGGS